MGLRAFRSSRTVKATSALHPVQRYSEFCRSSLVYRISMFQQQRDLRPTLLGGNPPMQR